MFLVNYFYFPSVWGNTSKRYLLKLKLVQNFASRVESGLGQSDHISQVQRSLTWLFNDLVLKFKCVNGIVLEFKCVNGIVLEFKCVNGLAPDYLGKYFVKRSAVHNKNTREVTILWYLEVDCQQDKGHFTFVVQGNGMGLPTILRAPKKYIVLSI